MPLTGKGVGGREGEEHPGPAVQPTRGAVGVVTPNTNDITVPLTGKGVGGREGAEHPSPAVQPTRGAVGGGDEVEGARHAPTRHPRTGEEVLQEGRALSASRQGTHLLTISC